MKTYYWLNRNRLLAPLHGGFLALAIAGLSLTLPSAEGSGSPPGTITGGFSPCFNFAGPPRQVGQDTIITFMVTADITGDFNGTLAGTELDVIHRDGSITLHGTALFSGLYGDRSGTFIFTYTGIGNAVTGHETLNFVGRRGTDGLAGIYTQGTAEGDLVPGTPDCLIAGAGTYTGHVVFAP
jgi:hypothetical protein